MRIALICGFDFGSGAGWWGNDLPPNVLDLDFGKTLGGGEEAALQCAAGLQDLGHSVTCWWYAKPGNWRGVEFRSLQHDLYVTLQSTPFDAVVAFSALQPLEWAPKGAVRIYAQQLNDLFQMGDWSRVDCVVSPSQSHAEQLPGWGWRGKPYAVVHNGLNEMQYRGVKVKDDFGNLTTDIDCRPIDWVKRPLNVGYWSSPDRGLHHLLRAWPRVHAAIPEARLHVFYELDRFIKSAVRAPGFFGDRARLIAEQLPRAKADRSITFHGAVPRNQLRKTQFQTRVMCYPYMPIYWCEGFCGSVNQGIAAGCHVMTTPRDALPSLYGGAVSWLPVDPGEMDDVLPQRIVDAVLDTNGVSTAQVRKAEPHRFNFTWERAAKEMEDACLRKGWKLTGLTEKAA